MSFTEEPGSFRDRDGYVFYQDHSVYRCIRPSYSETFDMLREGLLHELIAAGSVLPVFEESASGFPVEKGDRVIRTERIPFISYPSEWTFTQLRRAALLTLELQIAALQKNFTLKDASTFNVQFRGRKAVFIDHLSFEVYQNDSPWKAYGQFCRHFLGPLMLMNYRVPRVNLLFRGHLDGLPLDLCSKMLPLRSRFSLAAATHIHAHARLTRSSVSSRKDSGSKLSIPKSRLIAMLEHMKMTIKGMKAPASQTAWTDYYAECTYSAAAMDAKKDFVNRVGQSLRPALCLDLGANTGEFSALLAGHSEYVVACDGDDAVVERMHSRKSRNVLPLHIDLANPTPAAGWESEERRSFMERCSDADLVLALALIHHLCIGNNVPMRKLASFFSRLAKNLIIEFVPKSDVQVQRLLATRSDIFSDYEQGSFLREFGLYFNVIADQSMADSDRRLFHLRRKDETHQA